MKKIIFSIMAVSALFACQKEALVETPQAETVTFTAFVDGADTKTVLNETTKYSEWVAGDKITIHNGTKGFDFSTVEAGASAEFSYTGNDFSGNRFMAVYPAGNYTVDIAAKTVNAYIPTWQQAQTGTYHNTAALAVAYSENDAFAFRNATALLKFTVNADNVTHVVFHGNNGEALTGNAKVVLGGNGVDVTCLETEFTENQWNEAEQKNEEVTVKKYGTWVECYAYHDDDNKHFVKDETYYIAVAPAALTKGATVKFRINDGEEIEVKTTADDITIEPNTIYNLGELKYEAVDPATLEWAIVGSMPESGWSANIAMTLEGEWRVAKNITILTSDGFKFRVGTEWDTMRTYTETKAVSGTVYTTIDGQGSDNEIKVEASAIYDVYLSADAKKFKIEKVADYVEPEVTVETLYLNTGGNTLWNQANARFSAYFWADGVDAVWVDMTLVSGDIYKCTVPKNCKKVIFCRMNPEFTGNDWDKWSGDTLTEDRVWNQTSDLTMSSYDCYTITGWNNADGKWSKYSN